MNTPFDDKNIVIWNDQPLDTWRDIIVSFEYSRYNVGSLPTGGFAVVFFDSIVNQPRYGGRDYSLGYAPNNVTDYCLRGGYYGLEAAFLAVGFDNYGYFNLKQTYMTGIPVSALNVEPALGIRGSALEGYGLLYSQTLAKSISSIEGAKNFTIAQNVANIAHVKDRAVRVILGKHATEVKVQVKDDILNDDFVTIATYTLPEKERTALKVGLTHTTAEGRTMFNIKNINVAGFPGEPTQRRLAACTQTITKPTLAAPSILSMGDEYITTAEPGRILTYTSNTYEYILKNTLFSGGGVTLLGDDGKNIIAKYNGSSTVAVFTYLGEKLYRTAKFITPDNTEATSADIKDGTLVICTAALSGRSYIYNYSLDPDVVPRYGTWDLFQTIAREDINPITRIDRAYMGNSVQISDKHLLIGDYNNRVHAFLRDEFTNNWTYIQTLTSSLSAATAPTTDFGAALAIDGNDLIIGAPNSVKAQYTQPGQGECFHYIYEDSQKQWRLIMALGSFYNLDTPGGNFGTSIKLINDTCVIGSPGEIFVVDPVVPLQLMNVGKIYVFRKAPNGLFSQAAAIAPPENIREANMFFGTEVSYRNNVIAALSPYGFPNEKSRLHLFRADCEFPTAPTQLPVPPCALVLIDGTGFIIDLVNNNYMVSYSCLIGGNL